MLPLELLPEILLGFGILVALITGCFTKQKQVVWVQALLILLVCALVLILVPVSNIVTHHWVVDNLAQMLKIAALLAVVFCLLYGKFWTDSDKHLAYEAIVLTLIALLGSWVLISARHILTLFVGLELMSLPLYALVAIRAKAGDSSAVAGIESAVKYFITGSMASACLLYGLSLIFAATGQLGFSEIISALVALPVLQQPGLIIGIVFVVVAVAFKFGLVPFHMWVPDVYEGAPLNVTLLIATLPKIALVGLSIRLFGGVLSNYVSIWQPLFILAGIASIVLGNSLALLQTNLPRMLGYSSIAHMGILVLAFIVANQAGWQAAVFYILTYILTTTLLFGGLLRLNISGNSCRNISDLNGLAKVDGKLAFILLLGLFSLAGVPPIVGFIAKFTVLKTLIANGYLYLALVVVIMSCVGCFYYIKVIRAMYFSNNDSSSDAQVVAVVGSQSLYFNAVLVVLIGVVPSFMLFNIVV